MDEILQTGRGQSEPAGISTTIGLNPVSKSHREM
jgi:hypothetical protein